MRRQNPWLERRTVRDPREGGASAPRRLRVGSLASSDHPAFLILKIELHRELQDAAAQLVVGEAEAPIGLLAGRVEVQVQVVVAGQE